MMAYIILNEEELGVNVFSPFLINLFNEFERVNQSHNYN